MDVSSLFPGPVKLPYHVGGEGPRPRDGPNSYLEGERWAHCDARNECVQRLEAKYLQGSILQ